MALTFEAFVRDRLKPAVEAAEIEQPQSARPAAPAPAPKQQDQAPDPDAPKKSDFRQ